jgi:hypothetical protein
MFSGSRGEREESRLEILSRIESFLLTGRRACCGSAGVVVELRSKDSSVLHPSSEIDFYRSMLIAGIVLARMLISDSLIRGMSVHRCFPNQRFS